MKKILMALLGLMILSTLSYGGWEHLVIGGVGKTQWTESPTAATCWLRNNITLDVCPAIAPSVYFNTIRIEEDATIGEHPSFGLWGVNSSGDFYPLANVGVVDYLNMKYQVPGWRYDVEWKVNSDGDLVLKD